MVPDLEEWVDHGCVPLHADGDCEVDGTCQSYLGQGQQHGHQVGVPGLAPDTDIVSHDVESFIFLFVSHKSPLDIRQ